MARFVFDCETDGLLDELTTIHSLVVKNIDTGRVWSCCEAKACPEDMEETIENGLSILMGADQVIGHNIIAFDIPALQKVYPWFDIDWRKIVDTLSISRLIWPNRREDDFNLRKKAGKDGAEARLPAKMIGRHSLESWGYRLREWKGDYAEVMKQRGLDPWAAWNPEMQEYCEQDVEVTAKLYLLKKVQEYSAEAIELERDFAYIIDQQERHGFPFDTEAARQLLGKLQGELYELEQKIQEVFKPWEVRTPFIPKVNNKKLGYVKGQLTYKTKTVVFNPASRDHIASRLIKLRGWSPTEQTKTGKPKVDENILMRLPWPEAQLLAEYLTVEKRIGMLGTGNQALLKCVRPDGRIHGRVNTNGAVTGRCTHSHPNVAQTPSVGKPYGKEFRSLYTSVPGFKLVGADASGLELRCLGSFMARHDGGKYVKVILYGDVHTANQKAAGLSTRDKAKTFIYAFLYGAGDELLGAFVCTSSAPEARRKAGRKLRRKFVKGLPALGKLIEKVQEVAKERGWLRGLDGRRVHVRHFHAVLNTLLQSAGALIMKKATVILYEHLLERGWSFGVDFALVAHVHDEFQLLVREEIADEVGKLAVQSIREAGEHFRFRCPLDGEYKVGNNWADTH